MAKMTCQNCGATTPRHGGRVRCNACYWKAAPVLNRAHGAVSKAVRRGDLPDLRIEVVACTDCGERAHCYDHRDYLRPLDVEPVCRACNRRRGPGANLFPTPEQEAA